MLILAAIPNMLQERLARSVDPTFELISASGWSEAVDVMLKAPIELAVMDPALESEARVHEIERFRVLFPSVPIILYTKLSEHVASLLLRLGAVGIDRLVLAWHDDHRDRLRDLVSEESAHAVSRLLAEDVSSFFINCPPQLRWAIETMIREPARMHTVNALADRAGIDRRTCLRWFARAGLPKPSIVLTALRVLYAHRLLQDPGHTVDNVAKKLGYGQSRSLGLHVREVFDMAPSQLRVSLSTGAAVEIVRKRLAQTREPLAFPEHRQIN
jgi:AraC-like DNA-binding protein